MQGSSSLAWTGRVVIAIGGAGGLAVMAVGFASGRSGVALAGLVVGAVLAVFAVGLLLATAARTVVFDFAAREVGPRRARVSLDDVDALRLRFWSRPSRHANARRDSGWRVELEGARLAEPVLALDSADELAAWRAAEALARKLEVPMVDDTGEDRLLRESSALDQPLVEWVARQPSLPAPGDPPPSLTVIDEDDRWRVEHAGAPWWLALEIVGAVAVVVAFAAAVGVGAVVSVPMICAIAAVELGRAVWGGAFGRRAVELAGDALSTHGPRPRGTATMPIATLERVRLATGAIHFVGDDVILRLQIGGDERLWIRRALLHRLHARCAPRGPYR